MRYGVLIGLILALSLPVNAQVKVELGFGPEKGKVAFFNSINHPGEEEPFPLGPLSFRINGNESLVADSLSGRIYTIDSKGDILSALETVAKDEKVLIEDIALVLNAHGKIEKFWVADGQTQTLTLFSVDGKKVRTFGGFGDSPGQFRQIFRIEVGPSGNLYVSDKGRQKIFVFQADGKLLREVDWQWSGFCLDKKENLYLLKWNEEERKLHLIVETSAGKAQKDLPLDLDSHLNPELWFVNSAGETFLTYNPENSVQTTKLAQCSADGKIIGVSDLKIPIGMNRFLEPNDRDSLWLAEADFGNAPKGSFKVIRFDLGGVPEG